MRRLSRTLLLYTWITTLFFQGVVAVAMPCGGSQAPEQTESAHAHHQSHAEPGHQLSAEAGHQATDTSACCDGGYCSLGGCVPVLAIPQAGPLPEASRFDAPVATDLYRPLSRAPANPFRPPAVA